MFVSYFITPVVNADARLFELSQNLLFSKQKELFVVDFDFGAAVLGQQDLITGLYRHYVQRPRDILFTGSHRDHRPFVGIFGLVGGQVNSRSRLRLFGRSSDQDAVAERGQGSCEGLYTCRRNLDGHWKRRVSEMEAERIVLHDALFEKEEVGLTSGPTTAHDEEDEGQFLRRYRVLISQPSRKFG